MRGSAETLRGIGASGFLLLVAPGNLVGNVFRRSARRKDKAFRDCRYPRARPSMARRRKRFGRQAGTPSQSSKRPHSTYRAQPLRGRCSCPSRPATATCTPPLPLGRAASAATAFAMNAQPANACREMPSAYAKTRVSDHPEPPRNSSQCQNCNPRTFRTRP